MQKMLVNQKKKLLRLQILNLNMVLKLMEFYLKNKHYALIFLSFSIFYNCKNEEKTPIEPTQEKVVYEMYQPSEMAGFMNAMYAYNQQLKAQIVAGETPNSMPLDLLKLHSAENDRWKI
eukprot:TRINITY_DN18550_c0_g1_i2.p1 TRINITY_DN18550_c0_g1~~TRINITY_DN18550_c0_g1_i2.p1  ORF type:complete len:119 (+),score=16.60 TRINITY_DN18550_c0_g1_i2:118-474(+)